MTATVTSAPPTPWLSCAAASLEGGWLPTAGGVRPQLLITTDLETLLGGPGGLGGGPGWGGLLDQPACRRLACDGAVTRVLVTRQPIAGHGPAPTPTMARAPAILTTQAPTMTQALTTNLAGTLTLTLRRGSKNGCGRPWPCCLRPWAAPPASPWTSAGPPESSNPPSA
jgi:hypothetical protein